MLQAARPSKYLSYALLEKAEKDILIWYGFKIVDLTY